MIDLNANLHAIEELMKLMEKYKVDELSCDFLNLKRTRHTFEKPPVDESVLFAKHLQTSSTDPWDDLPQETVDAWSQRK